LRYASSPPVIADKTHHPKLPILECEIGCGRDPRRRLRSLDEAQTEARARVIEQTLAKNLT
jgi:hypothetical protein